MNTKQTAEGWMILDPKYDLISGWIESEKNLQHDKFLPEVAVKNMRPGIVIDCGAHVGSHSIRYSQHLGDKGSLICIEAGKTTFECLVENSKKFHCHTSLLNACVSDVHGGHAKFTVNEVNAGGSFTSEQKNGNGEIESNEIRTITLDGFCEDAGIFNGERPITFIKIDVEGFEYKALCGMKNVLKRFKPVLLIEFNSFRLSENGSDYKQIYDWLLAQNYSWRIVQPEAKGADLQYDVLAWPNPIEVAKVLPNG